MTRTISIKFSPVEREFKKKMNILYKDKKSTDLLLGQKDNVFVMVHKTVFVLWTDLLSWNSLAKTDTVHIANVSQQTLENVKLALYNFEVNFSKASSFCEVKNVLVSLKLKGLEVMRTWNEEDTKFKACGNTERVESVFIKQTAKSDNSESKAIFTTVVLSLIHI